ncbi:hypothetical protein [Nocardiopsis sp. CNT312]|uniref:hypothetical protein n=1 Tax=Nocardiopsis sp. CNT312 TaxID=1137268 RepID=UPI00350FB34D
MADGSGLPAAASILGQAPEDLRAEVCPEVPARADARRPSAPKAWQRTGCPGRTPAPAPDVWPWRPSVPPGRRAPSRPASGPGGDVPHIRHVHPNSVCGTNQKHGPPCGRPRANRIACPAGFSGIPATARTPR